MNRMVKGKGKRIQGKEREAGGVEGLKINISLRINQRNLGLKQGRGSGWFGRIRIRIWEKIVSGFGNGKRSDPAHTDSKSL